MGHSEQNNTRIDKSYRNGSNATNAIMVQQIVRTCIVEPRLLKANNCNSQVKTKNILYPKLRLLAVISLNKCYSERNNQYP